MLRTDIIDLPGTTVKVRRWKALLLAVAIGLSISTSSFAASKIGIQLPNDPNIHALQALVNQSADRVDFAKAKVTIDHMIDPTVDEASTLESLDAWAKTIRTRIPPGASNQIKLMALGSTLYQSGPWNDYKPFTYDFDDPFGKHIQNKLISHYLATRKGNCVSMPALLVILGQKIGLDVTLAVAPSHNFLMFHQKDGTWVNIEATSGTSFRDSDYQRQLHITPLGMRTGIYLRPLSGKEIVGAMMGVLEELYAHAKPPEYLLGLTALALKINPRDTDAMIWRGDAYDMLLRQRYMSRYPQPNMIPVALRGDFQMLSESNLRFFHEAEALGWHQPTAAEDAQYLERVRTYKAQHGQ